VTITAGATRESLYEDQAEEIPAGNLNYTENDAAQSFGGGFAVTQGRYAGLIGNYFQARQSSGVNGNLAFTISDTSVVDGQFIILPTNLGAIYGKSTNGVALSNGYSQTELVTYFNDGTMTATSRDSHSLDAQITYIANFSATGTVTGQDAGLPAKISWDSTGSGSVTFADGTIATFVGFTLD
jgi:hypothetical protein